LRFFLFILILFISLCAEAKSAFPYFVDAQIKLVKEMNDSNITQKKLVKIYTSQDNLYDDEIEYILTNSDKYISDLRPYDNKIFSLQKSININKRYSNTYAVLRDEILVDSYKILNEKYETIHNVLSVINHQTFEEFKTYLNQLNEENSKYLSSINSTQYEYILKLQDNSKILIDAKENLKNYYALIEVSSDFLNHLIQLEGKMYKLNKYSKYHLIKVVLYINNTSLSKAIEPVLSRYNLSTTKILLISLIIIFIYTTRKIFIDLLVSLLLKIDYINLNAKDVVAKLKKPIEIFTILINVDLIIYIYNDFGSLNNISSSFNILYTIVFIWVILIITNEIARIKIMEIGSKNKTKNVKNEVINVSIKILNFAIIIIGILIILKFAGVDLTAVLSGLGIGGLAVALAAKDSLTNFFGTLSILIGNTFSQGDWIAIDKEEGTVVEIGLRVTTIRTFDNALVAVPNGTLATVDVKNWNKRRLGRRIKMKIGVKYDSKMLDIQNAVNEIRKMLILHSGIASEHTQYNFSINHSSKLVSKDDEYGVKKILLVYLDEFSASSIDILVYCFSKSVVWEEWLQTKEDVMYKIMEILEKNSLEFAFPSLSIYDEKISKE